MDEQPRRSIIRSPSSRERTQIEYIPAVIRMHTLTEDQLEKLAEGGATANLGLAGATFGAAVTAAVTLSTVEMGPYVFASFVAGLIATGALTIFFGLAAHRDHRRSKQQLNDIKSRPSGSVPS